MMLLILTSLIAYPCLNLSENPLMPDELDLVLQYDDGNAEWLWFDQPFRGTWFHLGDFCPGAAGFQVEAVEYWFYHLVGPYHTTWESDSFGSQLWSGGSEGPQILLDTAVGVASHYTATFVEYPENTVVEDDFWVVACLSYWNGSPTPLTDEGVEGEPHSYYSSDLVNWEPLLYDYLFRVHGEPVGSLESHTWAAIKRVFSVEY